MITDIKRVLKDKGFALQGDSKTYRRGNEKIYWCLSGCNTAFQHSIDGKQAKSIQGSGYKLIMDYVIYNL